MILQQLSMSSWACPLVQLGWNLRFKKRFFGEYAAMVVACRKGQEWCSAIRRNARCACMGLMNMNRVACPAEGSDGRHVGRVEGFHLVGCLEVQPELRRGARAFESNHAISTVAALRVAVFAGIVALGDDFFAAAVEVLPVLGAHPGNGAAIGYMELLGVGVEHVDAGLAA